ncbi:MAG: VWA domain-containing protein, partial [Lachnospiraceae bacterium]|nr:VWA domain-containing protein [Lachnospiraceae bacterium]
MKLLNKLNSVFKLRRLFLAAAVIVVFVTTYALVLPAITMENKTYCGMEEHEHSDSCYTVTRVCVCGQEEIEGHEHTDDCYSEEEVLICDNEEEDHVHDEKCYEIRKTLTCKKEEMEGHKHVDSCFVEESELTCTLEEHIHDSECFVDPNAEPEPMNGQDTADQEDSGEDLEEPGDNYEDPGNDSTSDPEDDITDPADESTTEEPAMTSLEENSTEEYSTEENSTEENSTEENSTEENSTEEYSTEELSTEETNETETMSESEPELTYPEMVLSEKIKKNLLETWIEIEVYAPEGAVPEGSKLQLEQYELGKGYQETFEDALDNALEGGLLEYKAVKISFIDAAGMPVVPLREVQVYIKDSIVKDAEKLELVQIDDEEKNDLKTILLIIDEEENENTEEDVVTYQSWPNDPAVLAVASTTLEKTLTAEGDDYTITVGCGAKACVPAGASLKVEEIQQNSRDYDGYVSDAEKTLDVEEGNISYARFFDITIVDRDGNEIQPKEAVDVKIELADLQENIEDDDEAEPQVLHFGEGDEPEMVGSELDGDEVSFAAEGFSVYGVVYTVDFSYAVNGRMYEFSIPGGGFVSFEHLAEVLGMGKADADTAGEETAEEAEASTVEEHAEEAGITEEEYITEEAKASEDALPSEEDPSAFDEAIRLNEIEVSEDTRKFVADVERVAFSSPELVWVGKISEAGTVGGLKETNGLEVEYSTEMTRDQIAEINAQTVEAGDWALISLHPFMSEEILTVTMKNGEQFAVKVTDAQISANVLTADGEHFRITVNYEDDAEIPKGAKLTAEEIPEGSEKYEKYLKETEDNWKKTGREGYFSLVRFFDIEITKDGKPIEPKAPVEVEIKHEDGLTLFNDESLSVIHFADKGTEFIDELHRDEKGTDIVYEQESFSVIGTVSTVKENGWPTSNGQYVLVLQDGDDYYALNQDGTLIKVRYFNNTVSFIGEGTTTTDYIDDYLWYVVSSGNRGKISDEYIEYNDTPDGQTFIDPYYESIFSGTARQLQIRDGKIWCSGQLPGSSSYTQVTLSASDGQLGRVALTSESASPVFFASASTFTANDNETDLFTQVEVESIINKWKEQKTKKATYDKTAEVYDYENRIYQVDITASSSDYEVSPGIALEFVVDASRSMFFPTSVTEAGTFTGTDASNVRDWINANGDQDQVYFVIQNKNGAATQYAIFYDSNENQWRWVDASNYNPPDDRANGGTSDSRYAGNPLSSWSYGNMDDGKIYTTGITGTSDGTYGTRKTWISRIEYLKQCARVASQVIYAVDENAQIGLIGFNANVTDYGTFGKSEQEELLYNIDNISLAGGTNHQAGLQTAIDKYQDQAFYNEHYAGRKHVVVLVTDGAPNQSGVTWTTIGNVASTLKNLEDDFGNKTELYTMGLSLSNVGSNQSNLFNISSGEGYTYAGEDAAQIINAVTKIVDGIFVQANLVADVTDVIDPAFYPVNKANGLPLAENDWIKLDGSKANPGADDAAGQIKKDASTGNWYVEWKNQSIDWPTTDSNGAITEPGWHGTVFVKAKEDFLGGNGISTNAEGSQIEATKFIVRGETTPHDLPEGDQTTSFETPYVNVDELDITKNDTEWTVYLGTNVDPLKEVKALWEKVKVKEVVSKTDSDHRVSSDGSLTYQYASNTSDNRPEVNGREEFPISDLGITLSDADWEELIAGNSKTFPYSAYDHSSVGTIQISLTQEVKTGEKDLSESPHDTTVTGSEVEKYTLTVSYRPAGANISNWHTGSFGSEMSGKRAGNIRKDNTHIINVFVKGLQITKVDLNDQPLIGAKFALYRTARSGETDLLEINGGQYHKVA